MASPGQTPAYGQLVRAREFLRALQARWADESIVPREQPSLSGAVLEEFSDWDNFDFATSPDIGSASPTQVLRFQRTRAIVERIQPGPLEHRQLILTLAWQAAAIELDLKRARRVGGRPSAPCLPIFGTSGEASSRASVSKVGDVPVIVLSAGLVSCLYALAKAVVLSWQRVDEHDTGGIAFSSRMADTRASLDRSDMPVRLLTDALRNWLSEGIARSTRPTPVETPYEMPLTVVVSCADRFVLAHEYWHACVGPVGPPSPSSIEAELAADEFAMLTTASSTRWLDGLSVEHALQGCLLAMSAHEIADDLIGLARGENGAPSATHPPFVERARAIVDRYRKDNPEATTDASVVLATADAAAELWRRAKPRIEEDMASVDLHPGWAEL